MPLQYIHIEKSEVRFANEEKDPVKRAELLEEQLALMLFDSMQDKERINQLEIELTNALREIEELKRGGNQ